MVGGAATRRNIDALARLGHLVLVATLGDRNADLPLNKLVGNQLTVSGSTLRPQTPETKAAIASYLREHLWPALPTIGHPKIQHFRLAQASAAHRAMEDRAHIGKVVLLTDFGAKTGNR